MAGIYGFAEAADPATRETPWHSLSYLDRDAWDALAADFRQTADTPERAA